MRPVYFLVDALDECDNGEEFLALIEETAGYSSKVRWLVSSRPYMTFSDSIAEHAINLNSDTLQGLVNFYIEDKISQLQNTHNYSVNTLEAIRETLVARADSTFLWVWFVSKEPNSDSFPNEEDVYNTVQTFPTKLKDVYDRVVKNVEKGHDADRDRYVKILRTVYMAFRPLSEDLSALTRVSMTPPFFYATMQDLPALRPSKHISQLCCSQQRTAKYESSLQTACTKL